MQTNEEKKIANCPFCRATAQLYIRNNQYTVRCNNHNCIAYDIEPHFIYADSAIAAWNESGRVTVHLSHCDACAYNPTSSGYGKPCSIRPSIRKEDK